MQTRNLQEVLLLRAFRMLNPEMQTSASKLLVHLVNAAAREGNGKVVPIIKNLPR